MNSTLIPTAHTAKQNGETTRWLARPCPASSISHFHRRLLLVAAALLLTFLPQLTEAQVPIESMQREFQARFHFVTYGNYVLWPPCRSGLPAPLYPPDKFYGDLSGDPLFAA